MMVTPRSSKPSHLRTNHLINIGAVAIPKAEPAWQAGTTHRSGKRSWSRGHHHRFEVEEAWLRGIVREYMMCLPWTILSAIATAWIWFGSLTILWFRLPVPFWNRCYHVLHGDSCEQPKSIHFLREFVIPRHPCGASSIKIVPCKNSKAERNWLSVKCLARWSLWTQKVAINWHLREEIGWLSFYLYIFSLFSAILL